MEPVDRIFWIKMQESCEASGSQLVVGKVHTDLGESVANSSFWVKVQESCGLVDRNLFWIGRINFVRGSQGYLRSCMPTSCPRFSIDRCYLASLLFCLEARLALLRLALARLTLLRLALPGTASPCYASPCNASPCLASLVLVWHRLALPCLVCFCLALPCLALPCLALPWVVQGKARPCLALRRPSVRPSVRPPAWIWCKLAENSDASPA